MATLLAIDNEGELSNYFSIHLLPRYINFEKIMDTQQLHRNFQNNLINNFIRTRERSPSRIDND